MEETTTAASPPTTYHVHARTTQPGTAEVEAGAGNIAVDAAWGGARSGLPGPAELLASAFAACLLKNLARTRELLGFSFDAAEVDVTARRQDAPPKFVEVAYTLRITTDEPDHRVELVHTNLRRFGTVYNTLAAVCDVHGEVVAERTRAHLHTPTTPSAIHSPP